MHLPPISRFLPFRVREGLYYRFFHARSGQCPSLFESAELAFAPDIRMHGLLPGDVISGNIAFNGFYELALTRHIAPLARKGGVFVDVGANMGYFSLLWAGQNPNARAIAFEASPRNVEILRNNVNLNGLGSRISIVPKAAGNHEGTISFDPGPATQTGWGGISASPVSSSITVPLCRLDEEISEPVDVLKIDVEGADTWVLHGCEKLLEQDKIKTIFFEQNTERMDLLGIPRLEAVDFLQKFGYSCSPLDKAHEQWKAVKTEG